MTNIDTAFFKITYAKFLVKEKILCNRKKFCVCENIDSDIEFSVFGIDIGIVVKRGLTDPFFI